MYRLICFLTLVAFFSLESEIKAFPVDSPVAQNNQIALQAIAEQITVRVAGRNNHGSGVLVGKEGNNYYVLTNAHVANKNQQYAIATADGKIHQVEKSWYPDGLDLALLVFSSNSAYAVAEIDRDAIAPDKTIYVTGYPRSGGTLRQPIFVTTAGKITEANSNLPLGYSFSYSNLVRSGMSGGAILDAGGKLIGVNGVVRLQENSDRVIASGIPIGEYLQWRENHPDLRQINFTPSPIAATNNNNSASLYNLQTTISPAKNKIQSFVFDPQSNNVIGGDEAGKITSWKAETGKKVSSWQSNVNNISAIAISPDGKILVVGGGEGIIEIFNLANKQSLGMLPGHTAEISSIKFSPDGETIITSSWDKTIRLWSLSTKQEIATLTGHSQLINAIAISEDGKILASGSQDTTIRLWDLQTQKTVGVLQGHSLAVLSLAITPDGKTLVSGAADGKIKTWDLPRQQLINTWEGHNDGVWSIAIAGDSQTLFTSSWDKTITTWDLPTGKETSKISGQQDAIFDLILSLDDRILLGRSWEGKIYLWEGTSPQL